MELEDNEIEILACDIAIRPRDAAGYADLLPYVREMKLDGGRLTVAIEASGKQAVESFVNAERQCCTGLTWQIEDARALIHLIVGGKANQLQVVKSWFDEEV